MKINLRKIGCLCLTALMLASFGMASYNPIDATFENGTTRYGSVVTENVTGKVDVTSVVMDNLSPNVLSSDYFSSVTKNQVQTVIFTLDKPAIIDYINDGATVNEFLNTDAGVKALNKIKKQQKEFLNSLKLKGISYDLVDTYDTIINAVAVKMSVSDAKTVSEADIVIGSEVSETYAFPKAIDAQENPSNIYETGIYDTSEYSQYGAGVTVAVLDTGLDYTHEAFQTNPTTLGLTRNDVKDKLTELTAVKRSSEKGNNVTVDDLYLSDKVPFAYDYADNDTDVYPSYSQHGVHVAGIIAGQADSYTDKDGNVAKDADGNVLSFRGSAPNAQLVICKVFTDNLESSDIGGATTEDIIAALEDCVKLNVDVINMSLGTSAGFSSITIDGDTEGDSLNKCYKAIQDCGISLMCAASNDYSAGAGSIYGTNLTKNPDSGTVGSPSTFDGAMSVASINGLKSPYMIANETSAIFFEESSDANGVQNDFIKDMLGDTTSGTFAYVVVPGIGQEIDYTTSVTNYIKECHVGGKKVIAVVKRGNNSFKDKVQIAAEKGADAVIIYNNVAGSVRMSLADLEDKYKIPAISVSIDAGNALTNNGRLSKGTLDINKTYLAGPFMNDYSSWGVTPDLQLKPDITSHGGEITSSVAGGYTQMSGTSMATPNIAGLTALVRSYVKEKFPELKTSVQIKERVNQLMMSTATIVKDQTGLSYSPRKQGSGLAVLENIMTSSAYLYASGTSESRPKIELGEDEAKGGSYTLNFSVTNFGKAALSFKTETEFFTETVASGGLAVAEKAYKLDGQDTAVWSVNGQTVSQITVGAGDTVNITVKITMSAQDKRYIESNFENGMFVEGFLKLVSATDGQCDLGLPFMGFYGNWEDAEMLDYDCFEIAEFKKDTSLNDDERPQATVWATQAYAMYYNNEYIVPMGSFTYVQDENADQIYTNEDYAAISCYNDYYGEGNNNNYMTTTGIKSLYAGLLRNAELVTYNIYNADTGEVVKDGEVYRVSKAYAGGGGAVPANVLLEYTPEELGLIANGKYKIDFSFYFKADDKNDATKQDNTFSMTFYVDYEAPVLVDAKIRYYDYKENNKPKQDVFLDLEIFDNHYSQSLLLCYGEKDKDNNLVLKLATEYVTPIYNPVKNGTTSVTIDITDFYDKYKDNLYVQINDYALNYNVFTLSYDSANYGDLPADFDIVGLDKNSDTNIKADYEITIGVNEAKQFSLTYSGDKNIANFRWESSLPHKVLVRNGEIFGVEETNAKNPCIVTVTNLNGKTKKVKVNVVDKGYTLKNPSLSFNVIENSDGAIQKPGVRPVKVNAGVKFKLELLADNMWYYPLDSLSVTWTSSNEKLATVTQDGEVQIFDEEGSVTITASAGQNIKATASFSVQDPFTVTNMTLTKYSGTGGRVVIPDDENIRYIGEEAFKDNETVTSIVIPKTVMQIEEFAFKNCVNLESVYFIQDTAKDIADAELTMILRYAFQGCKSLKKVDLSNVKIITVDKYAFQGCEALEEVVRMDKIGKMDDMAFAGCTSLKSADVSGLHTSGSAVFKDCTSLKSVTTDKYTVIGSHMFDGCKNLQDVTIKMANVADSAFARCYGLSTVTFGDQTTNKDLEFVIGANAFEACVKLTTVNFNGKVKSIENGAFNLCERLAGITLNSDVQLGSKVFNGCHPDFKINYSNDFEEVDGAIYFDNTLYKAPKVITNSFAIRSGTTAIASYAFQDSTFDGITEFTLPDTVTTIGKGAFASVAIDSVVLPDSLTEISESAFAESKIKNVTVKRGVTTISNNAFYDCAKLSTVTFEDNSSLKYIGNSAFSNCVELKNIILPDGATEMGDRVFAGCTALSEVTLPSLEKLGFYTFNNTPNLSTVTFGKNAQTTGNYTFSQDWYSFSDGNFSSGFYNSILTDVTFGDNTTVLGEYVFYANKNLTGIDLKNITTIGNGAFCLCEGLSTVTGLGKVTTIGAAAFRNCYGLKELNLTATTYIGNSAFAMTNDTANYNAYSSITIPAVITIENYAFYGSKVSSVTLPKSLKTIGDAAFGNSSELTEFTCKGDGNSSELTKFIEINANFFIENGVLYRVVSDGKYELVSYPTAKNEDKFTVKEGTVAIQGYAFSELKKNAITKVILPYSVKTIGDAAFYASGIKEYQFESITAPTLLYSRIDISTITNNSAFTALLNKNFEKCIVYYAVDIVGSSIAKTSDLKMYCPSNGVGYDNYLYKTYFGTIDDTTLGELEEDATRAARIAVEGFTSPEKIASTYTTKAEVAAFAEAVKAARLAYNNITSEKQRKCFGEENLKKLTEIETVLKSVKKSFGIETKVTKISLAADSAHKKEYKVGEKFNKKGLKLVITYDDYTTELADLSKITVSTDKLGKYDRYVTVSGYGMTFNVPITVIDDGSVVEGEGGCGSLIGGNALMVSFAAIAFAVCVIISKKVTKKR